MVERHIDVLIVGGGMVGATLACALGRQGFAVTLLEAREPPGEWPADSYDLRVSAITRASQRIFEHLEVWPAMAERRVTPYRQMRVWESADDGAEAGPGEIRFDAADIGEPDLGHIVENRVITAALWQALRGLDTVELICPVSVARLEHGESGSSLELTDGRRLSAALLVAADGARSRVRELAGLESFGWAYDQQAVVATLRPRQGHAHTAWQRFMPSGPLALLPLDRDLVSIVWSTRPEQAQALLAMDPVAFAAAVTEASQRRLGEMALVGGRAGFPLRLQHVRHYVDAGIALVGDAAHVIHPLAGQGVNLGLLDAAVLAEVLGAARAAGRPLGSRSTLRRYERARKADNLLVQGAMDAFKRLFGTDLRPLSRMRRIGLGLTDRITPIKRQLTRSALGIGGELPALARPFLEPSERDRP